MHVRELAANEMDVATATVQVSMGLGRYAILFGCICPDGDISKRRKQL